MNVKTIEAPTIHAALIEARRLLGDDVVLMESIPAEGGQPARITVMSDKPTRPAAPAPASTKRAQPALAEHAGGAGRFAQRKAPVAKRANGYGYGGNSDVAVAPEEGADSREGFSGDNGRDYSFDVGRRTLKDVAGDGSANRTEPRVEPSRRGITGPAGRGTVFPARRDQIANPEPRTQNLPSVQSEALSTLEQLLTKQLTLLHSRLDDIERRFDKAIIGAGQQWTVNPLFTTLMNQGMRPGTVTKIFDTLAQKGYQPDTNAETLKWAVAQEVRRSIDSSVAKQTSGAQVFIGPSGAGKTSLLLKLASHPGFYGRRETAVIVIEPEEETSSFHHSPVNLFRLHGLPVQSVRTVDDMRKAIMRVQQFDHILIDTPPMPLQDAPARKVLRHVKKLVDPIMPLRVQFVLNATRSLDDFSADFVRSLALRPEMVALTHLDETKGWGRIAEWLMAVEMPVQFVSTGPAVPDGVVSFSPTWFVEEMMKL